MWSGAASLALLGSSLAQQETQKTKPGTKAVPVQAGTKGTMIPASKALQGTVQKPAGQKATRKSATGQVKRKKRKPLSIEELTKRFEAVEASPFIAKGNWILDFDEAKARAKREGKLIFIYFTRSYAP